MGASQNGHSDPAALRQLAADWRAQGDRLETLGDNLMAAYNDVTWIGFASMSADIATNIVDLKLRQVQDAAHEFAKFLEDYADKVQEQIDKEKARTIIEIVLALLGLLTMGLAGILGPMLAALGRLLAGLLSAMGQLAGKIVTAVIDVAIGILVWGSLQVAMEFGTVAIVSDIMGVPAEYHATIAISVVIAGVMGGLFSIRGVNNVPVKGPGAGVKPGEIPNPVPTPKGGSGTDVTTNGALVNGPKPYEGTTVDGTATSGIDAAVVSATDIAPPAIPGASRGAPTGVGDQRVHSGAGSVGSAGRTAEHATAQPAPHTSENITTPATPAPRATNSPPAGDIGGENIRVPPRPGEIGTFNVETAPPGAGIVNRPPTLSAGDTPPIANLDRGTTVSQPPHLSAGGDVSPVSSVGSRGSMDLGEVSPLSPTPANRGSLDVAALGHGDLVAQPPPKTAFAGAEVTPSTANMHGTGRTVTPDNASTIPAGTRGTVPDPSVTSAGGHVTNPATARPGATVAPPGIGEHVPSNVGKPGGTATSVPSPHLGENLPAGTARPGAANSAPPSVSEHGSVSASSARGTSLTEVPAAGQGRGQHYTATSGPAPVPHGVNLPPAMRPGALPDPPAGTHFTAPPARQLGAEHLPSTTPGRAVTPEAPRPVEAGASVSAPRASDSSVPTSRPVDSGSGVSAPRTSDGSMPTSRPVDSGSGVSVPGTTGGKTPAGRPVEPLSRTETPEVRTGTPRSPSTEAPPVSASSAKAPVDAGQAKSLEDRFQALGGPGAKRPDAAAVRDLELRFEALGGPGGKRPDAAAVRDLELRFEALRGPRSAPADDPATQALQNRLDQLRGGTAKPAGEKAPDEVLQERLDKLSGDTGFRWSDDLLDDVAAPRSLLDQIKGIRGSKFPEAPAHDPGAGPGSGGTSKPSQGDAVKVPRSVKFPEPPKTEPSAPRLDEPAEFPVVPTGLERPRALIEDFGTAAGLPRRELDELLENLDARYGDMVLSKRAEAAATRKLIEDIGVRAGMDASVARGFAERATSPNTATSHVARTEFRAEIGAFADGNRMIERQVDLRIGRAEDAGVPMTQGIRKELTQAMRSGDDAALHKVTGDLDRAVAAREAMTDAAGTKSQAGLQSRLDKLKQGDTDRAAVAASDAAAEKAARETFTKDFREGPLAEFKQRVGVEDGASAAKAVGLKPPAEPTRVEPAAQQRHDDIVASEKEWAQYQRDLEASRTDLGLEPPPHQKEFDELLASVDDLGAQAGLGPKEITQIRADVEARYTRTVSLDEAKRTLLENTAVRAGMDPDRAATLAARDLKGGIGGRHARQVYGDELADLKASNQLIDRYVRLLGDDFERFGLKLDDAARERLTLAYRQGDEAQLKEITGPLDQARAVSGQRAARAELQADLDLAKRFQELRKPIEPAAAKPAEPARPPAETRTPEELEAQAKVQEAIRRNVLPELRTGVPLKPSPGPKAEPSVSERMGRADDVADPETQASVDALRQRFKELEVPKGLPAREELPAMPEPPKGSGPETHDSLRAFGKELAEDAGLDDAATTQLLKGIEDRWGATVLDDAGVTGVRKTLVEEMYGRYDVAPNKVRTEDLAGGDAELRDLARAGFRAELKAAQEMKNIGDRFADLTMPHGYDLADDFVNSARNRLAEAYRKGDFDSVDKVRVEIGEQVSTVTAKQHADELAAQAAKQTEAHKGSFGKVMDDLATRMKTDDVKPLPGKQTRPETIMPEGSSEGLLMAKPQPRDPNDTPPTVTRADLQYDLPARKTAAPTPLEQADKNIMDRNLAAVTAERDLHAAGLDPDSRFRAGVAEFRAANPQARFDLDVVRADYDARIAGAWRDKPEAASWHSYVAAAASALPQIIERAVATGVPAATTDVAEPVATVAATEFLTALSEVRDPESIPSAIHDLLRDLWIGDPARFAQELEAAELAADLFTRAAGTIDYARGLDLPAAVLDRMRLAFTADVLHNHDVIRYQGDDARFAEDGGRDAVWEAYQERQFKSVEADLRVAQKAWTAAQRAAEQFHQLVGAAPDRDLSDTSIRVLGEQFAAEKLALHKQHFYGLEDLQRQAFQERLDALLRPVDEVAALTDAERVQRWQQETGSLRAHYAHRLETATLAERHRPDLVRDFDAALAEARAETERTGLATLDGLPPGTLDALRADFVTTGRRWFEEVFAPAIKAGVRGYDSLFVNAETQWRHQYEHLRTSIRQDAFVHLQAHRHDEAVAAAVANHRAVSEVYGWDELPESAYAIARKEFLADAVARLRASVREQLDPFAKSQAAHWASVAAEIERSITRYFADDKLREYAARAQTTTTTTATTAAAGLLEAPPSAYEKAARPILEAVRTGVSAGLHRDGREVPADVRDRIAREAEAVLQEADTAARARAERGGASEIAIAAAVAELAERVAGLAESVPARLLHQEQIGTELRHAERAFEGLLATRDALPPAVVTALSVAFAHDWLTRYDQLFRGGATEGEARAIETGLRDLADRASIEPPNHDLLSPGALRKALLDAAAALPGGFAAIGSGLLLRQPGAQSADALVTLADSFVPIAGEQRVIVAPGADLAGFLTEVANQVTDPAQRSRIVVHAPLAPGPVLKTLGNRYGVTVAYLERPADPQQARRAVPVTADGTPTLQRWAAHWLVRPATQQPETPYGLRQGGRSGLFELPGGWVLEDLPWGAWARPAGSPDPELATWVRSGAGAGGAAIVVGAPGVTVPAAVARAGLDLVERLPVEPGQSAVHWLSPLPELRREALPPAESAAEPDARSGLDATSGGLSGVRTAEPDLGPARDAVATLRFAGHGEAVTAFLAEPDAAARDLLLLDLLGAGDAVRGALPELHLALASPARSDVALAGVLGYAQTALRGEPVPAARVLEAAKGLLVTTKGPLMNTLLSVAGPASENRAVLARFAELVFDC